MLAEREADGLTTIRTQALPRRQERATLGQKLRIAVRAFVVNVTGRKAQNPRGILASLALAALLTGCTSPDSAHRILAAEGYTDVQMTGYRLFGGCLKGESWHTGFRAVKNGRLVTGTVCGGLFSSVVRIDG